MGPLFAIIALAFFPLMIILLGVFSALVKGAFLQKAQSLKELGGIVEESLSSIKLIVSFANEKKEVDKFFKTAIETRKIAHKTDLYISMIIGLIRFLLIGFYSYAFWIGSVFVHKYYFNVAKNKDFDSGTILIIVMTIS